MSRLARTLAATSLVLLPVQPLAAQDPEPKPPLMLRLTCEDAGESKERPWLSGLEGRSVITPKALHNEPQDHSSTDYFPTLILVADAARPNIGFHRFHLGVTPCHWEERLSR